MINRKSNIGDLIMRKDLIIIPILLVGVVAGSVVGMGYSPAESPDQNQISNNTTTMNTSTNSTVQTNKTQQESTSQKSTSTTSTRKRYSSTATTPITNTQSNGNTAYLNEDNSTR